jgi:hypothetical protein
MSKIRIKTRWRGWHSNNNKAPSGYESYAPNRHKTKKKSKKKIKPSTVVMPWGKHKGIPMHKVPQNYLEWCRGSLKNCPLFIRKELDARKKCQQKQST